MKFFDAISLDEGKNLIIDNLNWQNSERVSLSLALNRMAAEDVKSKENLPPFNRSMVDGYAVCSKATVGASESSPIPFTLLGKAEMGKHTLWEIDESSCVFVPTGGELPKNADSVVMLEHTEMFGDSVLIEKALPKNANVVLVGEDVQRDERLISKGEKITPLKMALLLSVGVQEVEVYKKLKVGVISSGDELISPFEKSIDQYKIRDINSSLLVSELNNCGLEAEFLGIVKDDFEKLQGAFLNSLERNDITILTGGSSVGEKDFTFQIIEENTKLLFKGLKIKPGKPTICGAKNGKLALGLPGHPIAAYITAKLLFIGSLEKVGAVAFRNKKIKAVASCNFPSNAGKTTVVFCNICEENGVTQCMPIMSKSGLVKNVSNAFGYVVLDEKKEGVLANEEVLVNIL